VTFDYDVEDGDQPLHPADLRKIASVIADCGLLFRPNSDESLGVFLKLDQLTSGRDGLIESLVLFAPSGVFPASALPVLRRVQHTHQFPPPGETSTRHWPQITVEHFDLSRSELNEITSRVLRMNELLTSGINARDPDDDPFSFRHVYGEDLSDIKADEATEATYVRHRRRSMRATGGEFRYEVSYSFMEALDPEKASRLSNAEVESFDRVWLHCWQLLSELCRNDRLLLGCHEVYDLPPDLYRRGLIENRKRRDRASEAN
jgi:hypothetical protein